MCIFYCVCVCVFVCAGVHKRCTPMSAAAACVAHTHRSNQSLCENIVVCCLMRLACGVIVSRHAVIARATPSVILHWGARSSCRGRDGPRACTQHIVTVQSLRVANCRFSRRRDANAASATARRREPLHAIFE
jgi:hypothetical protein